MNLLEIFPQNLHRTRNFQGDQWQMFNWEELKTALRFYRKAPLANKQARQMCRDILAVMHQRKFDYGHN